MISKLAAEPESELGIIAQEPFCGNSMKNDFMAPMLQFNSNYSFYVRTHDLSDGSVSTWVIVYLVTPTLSTLWYFDFKKFAYTC